MKTNVNNTTANEAAKNTAIYNELADIARQVFNHINGTDEGKKYAPADIARAITGGPVVRMVNGSNYVCDRVEPYQLGAGLSWCEGFDPTTAYTVAVDGFSCRVVAWKIFDVLDRAARSLDIPTAARVTFERPRAASPVVASFSLSTTAARELAACCAKDELRPVLNGVQLDTRRRVLVASDGHVLRVVSLGAALTVDESAAAASYIIPADIIKSGRVVTITADGIAATDKKSAPAIAGRFPNWAAVVPSVSDAGRVSLTADQWKNLKKAVASAAAVHPKSKYNEARRVVIAHDFLSDVLHVWAFNYDFNLEKDITVPVDNVRESFSISFKADDFARIAGNVTAIYFRDPSRAIVTTDAAGLSLVMPLYQPDDESEKYHFNFNFGEGSADLLPGVDIAAAAREIAEENTAAAAAEIVEKVREECKGKNTAKMIKYINDNFGYQPAAAERARAIIEAAANESTNESTAAPAADQMTPAEAVSDRENEHNGNESADTITTNESAADVLPLVAIDDENGVILWARPDIDTTADQMTDESDDETPAPVMVIDTNESDQESTDAPAVVIAANFAHRARRWFQAAAAVLAVLIITAAPVAITTNESDTAAPAADQMTANETRADVLAIYEAVSDETSAAPAADQTTAADTVSAREIKRETPRPRRHHHRATVATVAAPVAITPDTLTADTLGAPSMVITPDTMTAPALVVDTLQGARNITETADTLSADTLETARDITAAPAADIDTDTDDETPAPVVITIDESDDDTAAPADDETSNDNESTTAPTSTNTTSTTTGTPSTSTTTAPASVVIVSAAPEIYEAAR